MSPKHLPDKEWMLVVISTLNSRNDIFSKNYSPPIRWLVKKDIMHAMSVSNAKGFFEELPPSKSRGRLFKLLVD